MKTEFFDISTPAERAERILPIVVCKSKLPHEIIEMIAIEIAIYGKQQFEAGVIMRDERIKEQFPYSYAPIEQKGLAEILNYIDKPEYE